MKRKIVSIAIVLCLAITAIAGATLAYFTDTDVDVNVMVSGNVEIVQNETDRYGDPYAMYDIYGETENEHTGFKSYDPMMLYPAVYLKANEQGVMMPYNPVKNNKGYTTQGPGGYSNDNSLWYTGEMENTNGEGTLKIYDDNINNEIDKVISVTNKGSSDIFVRTILLFENTADNAICDAIHCLWNNDDKQYPEWVVLEDGSEDIFVDTEYDGTSYSIAVCTYETAIEPDETTSPSLMQIFLDPFAGNDWPELLGEDGQFTIIAFSQAVQTVGFEEFGAKVALDTAFGEVTSASVAEWLNDENLVIKTNGDYNVVGGEKPQA